MKLNELTITPGSQHSGKRVGRGIGSGMGKTSTQGQKGQKSRSGGGTRLGFEGGQLPLWQRLPMRGFHSHCHLDFQIVGIGDLNIFKEGQTVTIADLVSNHLVKKIGGLVKILNNGELNVKGLIVEADKISASAKAQLEKLGGSVKEVC